MSVPVPAVKSAVEVLNPVKIGTRIVAPNIAKTCWMLKGSHRDNAGLSDGINAFCSIEKNNLPNF